MPDKAAERRFFSETTSKFEPLLIKTLCEPLLPHIPRTVHPNTISLVTHAVVWVTAMLAVCSVHMSPLGRALALVGAGVGMFLSMLGDCIDGLHARRTDQCAKLGELLDHWLDAIVLPLATVGITCALEMSPLAMVAVNVTAAMVYNAQLVLYHHTGRFVVAEPATGPEAQFGLSLGYVAMAPFFYYVERHQPWLDVAFGAVAVAGFVVQMRCNNFYYRQLGRLIIEHLYFVTLCGAFGALYLLDIIGLHAFLAVVVSISFRISGSYVLRTIVKERFRGNDLGIAAFAVLIAAVHYGLKPAPFGGFRVEDALASGACVYAVVRNFIELGQRFHLIQPPVAAVAPAA
jgi:phosphatidylglycerophosphate synthase